MIIGIGRKLAHERSLDDGLVAVDFGSTLPMSVPALPQQRVTYIRNDEQATKRLVEELRASGPTDGGLVGDEGVVLSMGKSPDRKAAVRDFAIAKRTGEGSCFSWMARRTGGRGIAAPDEPD